MSCTTPPTVTFHVPSANDVSTVPAGRATWGTPTALSVTSRRSTRRGTSGPASGAGTWPSIGTNENSWVACH